MLWLTYSWDKIQQFLCWLFAIRPTFEACSCVSYQHWMRHIHCCWHRREHSWMRLIWAENWEFHQRTMSSSSPLESSHAPPILIKIDVSSTSVRCHFFFCCELNLSKVFAYGWLRWCGVREDKTRSWPAFSSCLLHQTKIIVSTQVLEFLGIYAF